MDETAWSSTALCISRTCTNNYNNYCELRSVKKVLNVDAGMTTTPKRSGRASFAISEGAWFECWRWHAILSSDLFPVLNSHSSLNISGNLVSMVKNYTVRIKAIVFCICIYGFSTSLSLNRGSLRQQLMKKKPRREIELKDRMMRSGSNLTQCSMTSPIDPCHLFKTCQAIVMCICGCLILNSPKL